MIRALAANTLALDRAAGHREAIQARIDQNQAAAERQQRIEYERLDWLAVKVAWELQGNPQDQGGRTAGVGVLILLMSFVNRCDVNLENAFRIKEAATNPASGYGRPGPGTVYPAVPSEAEYTAAPMAQESRAHLVGLTDWAERHRGDVAAALRG